MATIDLTNVDILVLKKLALINHALALQLSDKRAAAEQMAMVHALTDIVKRADAAATPEASE